MRINGRRGMILQAWDDLEWRNVKQCYDGEIAYGMKTIAHRDQTRSWAGYNGTWGDIWTGPDMYLGRMSKWHAYGAADDVLLDKPYPDFRDSPYWAKQPDGTYLFTPSLFKAGKIGYDSQADSQWFLVHKSEPIKHTKKD